MAARAASERTGSARRGRGKSTEIDVHVGKRIRQRRLLLGMTQQTLADAVGVSFQQLQKYERGTNRVGAGTLFDLARVLDVPVSYFFAAIGSEGPSDDPFQRRHDLMAGEEGLSLVTAYFTITDRRVRQRLHDLVRAVAERGPGAAVGRL